MANGIKISQLIDGGNTTSSDLLPIARGTETLKILANQFVVDGQNVATGAQLLIGKQTDAGGILQFRTLSGMDGISIVNVGNTTVVSGSGQNSTKTVFTGTGSQVNFPFPLTNTSSRNVNNYRVDIDGVLQEPGQTADYFLNGSNLTFTSAPPLSSKIVVISNNLLPLAESVPASNSITNAMLTDGCVSTVELSSSVTSMLVPTGAIMPFYRPTAPDGWLICDGSAIPAQYTALIALLGSANTPNLRGMFIRGWSSGTSTTSQDPLSSSRTLGSIQTHGIAQHQHKYTDRSPESTNSASPYQGSPYGAQSFTSGGQLFRYNYVLNTLIENSTPAWAEETRPVNIALLYCIKT